MATTQSPPPSNHTTKKLLSSPVVKRLHLVSDPGFLRRYAEHLVAMIAVVWMTASVPFLRELVEETWAQIQNWMLARAHEYAWWSLLGLLASSCCALQLVLNAMSLGCAGLNTVLGPFRPTMLAFATLVQASSGWVAWRVPHQRFTTLASSLLTVGLALLPEILDGIRAWRKQKRKKNAPPQSPGSTTTTTRYRLQNVGCAACLATVSSILENLEDVRDFDVSLEHGGTLTVVTTNTTGRNSPVAEARIRNRLNEAGFPVTAWHPSESAVSG